MTELLNIEQIDVAYSGFWKNAHFMKDLPCEIIAANAAKDDEPEDRTIGDVRLMDFMTLDSVQADVCKPTNIPEATCEAICNDLLHMMGFKMVKPELEPNVTAEFVEGSSHHLKLTDNFDPDNEVLNIWIWMANDDSSFTVSVTTQEHEDSAVVEKQLPQWEVCEVMLKNGVYIF